jgi:hypothetical protein
MKITIEAFITLRPESQSNVNIFSNGKRPALVII